MQNKFLTTEKTQENKKKKGSFYELVKGFISNNVTIKENEEYQYYEERKQIYQRLKEKEGM
jgi:hypothetical protein